MCGHVVLVRDSPEPSPLRQTPLIPEKMSLRARFIQADKEACITLLIYIGYLLWWTLCAYGLGSQDPETYTYIWGLPAWFFYACVVGYPLLTFALWLVVVLFFKDMPIDDDDIEAAPSVPSVASVPSAPPLLKEKNMASHE